MHEIESINSPDGNVQFKLLLSKSRLKYEARFRNKPMIEDSPTGIVVDGINLTEGVEVDQMKSYRMNETYPWRGVHSQAVNHCNGAMISLKHTESNTSYTLKIRAFDDGIAFRQKIALHHLSTLVSSTSTQSFPIAVAPGAWKTCAPLLE